MKLTFKKKLLLIALLILLVYLYKAGYLRAWKNAALKGMVHLRKEIGGLVKLFSEGK